jgi:hypothetical protein
MPYSSSEMSNQIEKKATRISYFGHDIYGFEIATADGLGNNRFSDYQHTLKVGGRIVTTVDEIYLSATEDPTTAKTVDLWVIYYRIKGQDKIRLAAECYPAENVVKFTVYEKEIEGL